MILLGTILERVGGNNLHALGKSWFYSPLGMNNTFYNPPPNVWKDIPPTERTVVPIGTSKNSLRRKIAGIASELIGPMKSLSYDLYPRKTAHGYVHDENANLLGGISAHAGLFSNAEDLGKYSQMLLNDGMIGDKKIIDKELISLLSLIHI